MAVATAPCPLGNSTIEGLLQGLSDAGLPNIFIPAADGFLEVEEIPLLGTGKLDLKAVKQTALDHFGDAD